MAFCDAKALAALLSAWAHGSLDSIASYDHVVAGVEGCVMGAAGLRAESLLQRFTSEDVHQALLSLQRKDVGILVCKYFFGWTVEDLGRVLNHPDVFHTGSVVIEAEERFAEALMDGKQK